jgi:hypothetical protein
MFFEQYIYFKIFLYLKHWAEMGIVTLKSNNYFANLLKNPLKITIILLLVTCPPPKKKYRLFR